MTVYGTCGHQLRGTNDNPIVVSDKTREGDLCLSYGCVCDECYDWYKKKKLLIKNVKLWKKRHWGLSEDEE